MLPKDISPHDARLHLSGDAVLFDVREPDEWQAVHVADSTLIPLDSVLERLNEFPKACDIILICRSGRRSGLAQESLRLHGFDRVSNVTGGILAWQEAGLPVVEGP